MFVSSAIHKHQAYDVLLARAILVPVAVSLLSQYSIEFTSIYFRHSLSAEQISKVR